MIGFEIDSPDRHPERLKRPDFPFHIKDSYMVYADSLDSCKNLQEVFSLVKKLLKKP